MVTFIARDQTDGHQQKNIYGGIVSNTQSWLSQSNGSHEKGSSQFTELKAECRLTFEIIDQKR